MRRLRRRLSAHELAAVAGHPLPPDARVTGLRQHLAAKGIALQEIEDQHQLAGDEKSWLHFASQLRHKGIHDAGVSRTFSVNLGGKADNTVQLTHPKTGVLTGHYPDTFEKWADEMEALIRRHRSTAPTLIAPPKRKP